MNTANTTSVNAFPDSLGDLLKLDQLIDFEAFLNSDLLAAKRNENMIHSIAQRTSGSVSVIASTCLILHILRSHDVISTTYHWLVFGLSVGDIMSSFTQRK